LEPAGGACYMPIENEERARLRAVCGDLLNRCPEDVFTVQVERVLQYIKAGDCARIRGPEGVVKAFSHRGLAPRSDVAPRMLGLAIAFSACTFPRRIPGTDLEARLRLLKEMYDRPVMLGTMDVLNRLRLLGRLPAGACDELVLGLLADLTAASPDRADREERLAGAALYVAAMSQGAILGSPGGQGPRFGLLRNWSDDGEFVRFFRSEAMTGPPSAYAAESLTEYGTPSWGGVLPSFEAYLDVGQQQFARKAVDMERMLWSHRPESASSDEYRDCVHGFWLEQNQKLNSGFPQYAFESHFVQWWHVCALNMVKEFQRRVHNGATGPQDAEPGKPARGRAMPTFDIDPDMARILREGWRLVRTTFHARSTRNPAADSEALRRDLDELWNYHVRKDLTKAEDSETIQQMIERTGAELNVNTAATLVRRIKSRFRAYNLARLQGMTNADIRDNLTATGAAVEPAVDTIAAMARPVDRRDTLLWAFLTHVVLRGQIDTDHKDEWGLLRCLAEFLHWGGDPLFPGIIANGVARGRRPYATFLAAVAELLKDPPQGDPLEALRAAMAGAMGMFANRQYGELSDEMVAWAMRLIEATLNSCGCSVYRNLRLIFDLKKPKAGDGSEWIAPSWYLVFVEGLPNRGPGSGDAEAILNRLKAVTEEEKRAVRILTSMRLHCDELRREAASEAR